MVKVKSTVPLYVNGQVATEFETTEAHLKELQRLHGDKVRAVEAKKPVTETKGKAKS